VTYNFSLKSQLHSYSAPYRLDDQKKRKDKLCTTSKERS
jgi:hypothetical protein